MPNQDAECHLVGREGAVVAVSDGHGHERHFRSDTGSALAVSVAVRVMRRWLERSAGAAGVDGIRAALQGEVLPAIVSGWRAGVARHLAAHPLPPAGAVAAAVGDAPVDAEPPEVPYGTTLLVAAIGPRVAALAQIGDGDAVAVTPDGSAWCPVPDDPLLDGGRTTSLSQPDAVDAFRLTVLDLAANPIAMLLLATDGYGNAQAAGDWVAQSGKDLVGMAAEHGEEWIGAQLPRWVERCASGEGSGDDTTVAIAIADPAAAGRER